MLTLSDIIIEAKMFIIYLTSIIPLCMLSTDSLDHSPSSILDKACHLKIDNNLQSQMTICVLNFQMIWTLHIGYCIYNLH